MRVYYNDNDRFCCAWLAELIKNGLLPDGDIDSRSIKDIHPSDLKGYGQCHFFAGIGGWPYALQLAGWEGPVWTGSCPCQPFSVAGKRGGTNDPRHLWPDWLRLIKDVRPPAVFGEQVTSPAGRLWLTGVRSDLGVLGYAVGAAGLSAASVGTPHIRQRLYWVADAERNTGNTRRLTDQSAESIGAPETGPRAEPRRRGHVRGLGNTDDTRLQGRRIGPDQHADQFAPWKASVFIECADGKRRRVPAKWVEHTEGEQEGISRRAWEPRTTEGSWQPEPALFPLAHGIPNRVGTLRGAGNAIVPQVAAEFIQAAREALLDISQKGPFK